MTLEHQILIEALAFVAALHEPIRDPGASYWSATWVMRRRYPARGLPYRGGGTKEAERALRDLAASRLLVKRRAAQKTIGLRLTHSGMAEGWRLVGVSHDQAMAALREVDRLGPGGRWVPEVAFNDGRGWGDGHSAELRDVVDGHLPALTAGWVESNCDSRGRAGYRTTAIGKAAMRVSSSSPPASGGDARQGPPEPEEAALDLWGRSYAESIQWLNSQDAVSVDARGEIGNLPLPVSAWAGPESSPSTPERPR